MNSNGGEKGGGWRRERAEKEIARNSAVRMSDEPHSVQPLFQQQQRSYCLGIANQPFSPRIVYSELLMLLLLLLLVSSYCEKDTVFRQAKVQ